MSTTLVRRTTTSQDYLTAYSAGTDTPTLVNDELTSSYIYGVAPQGYVILNLDPVVIPDGAQIRSQTIKVEALRTAPGFLTISIEGLGTREVVAYAIYPALVATTYSYTRTTSHLGAWNGTTVNSTQIRLDFHPTVRISRVEVDTVYNEKPVTTVVSVDGSLTAPSFTTTSQRPKIWWSYSDPDGDFQERYEVKVFSDTQYNTKGFNASKTTPLFASGVKVSGSNNYKITKSLPNGDYWVAVHASDAGSNGRWSDWDIQQFTISGSPPLPPTLTSVTPDPITGSVNVLAQQNDNLLGYNQAGFENVADGIGWYPEANITDITMGPTAATNAEGANVLQIQTTDTTLSSVRSGGPWTDLGIASFLNIVPNPTREPVSVADVYPTAGGLLRTASFRPSVGDTLIAFVAFKTAKGANPTASATVTSSPTMTWTKQCEAKHSVDGGTGYVAIFTARVTSSLTMTVSVAGGTVKYGRYLKVSNFAGVSDVGPVGVTGHGGFTSGTLNASYISSTQGSVGFALSIDDKGGTIKLAANSGLIGVDRAYHQVPSYTVSVVRRTSPTPAAGTMVPFVEAGELGDTVWVVLELVPAILPPQGIPSDLLAGVPVKELTDYTITAGSWVATTANTIEDVRMDVEWYDSTAALISTTTGTVWSTTAGSLIAYFQQNVTSPVGATAAVLILNAVTPAAGQVYHWDKIGLILGTNQNWGRGGMQCRNLLNVIDGSQEGNNLGSWVTYSGSPTTVVSTIEDVNVMSGYGLLTYTNTPGKTPMAATGRYYNVDPGSEYTFYTMASTQAGTCNGWIYINFLDNNGTVISSAKSNLIALSSLSWSVLSVTATCPEEATAAQGVLRSDYVALANAVEWTRHGISPGPDIPTAWQPGPMPNTYPLIETSDDDGATWVPVADTQLANYDPDNLWLATLTDYEAPSNQPRLYRASTAGLDYGIDPLGFYVVSLPSAVLSSTLAVRDFYLVDTTTHTRYFVQQSGEIAISQDEPQTVYLPLGRSTSVVTYDKPKSKTLTFSLSMLTGDELDEFEALRRSGRILFLQTPYARSWYVKIGPTQKTTWLVSPEPTGRFDVSIDLIEVDRPT